MGRQQCQARVCRAPCDFGRPAVTPPLRGRDLQSPRRGSAWRLHQSLPLWKGSRRGEPGHVLHRRPPQGGGQLQPARSGVLQVSKPSRVSHRVAGRGRFTPPLIGQCCAARWSDAGKPGVRSTPRRSRAGGRALRGHGLLCPGTVSTVLEPVRPCGAHPRQDNRQTPEAEVPCKRYPRVPLSCEDLAYQPAFASVPTPGSVTRESRLVETVPLPARTRKVREEGRAISVAPSGALQRRRSNDSEGRRCHRLR